MITLRLSTAITLYTIAFSLFALMLLYDINLFRFIYPNYVGLLFVFGLHYTLTRRKAYDLVLMFIGGINFFTAIVRFAMSDFSEAAQVIYRPMLVFSILFLISATTYLLIDDYRDGVREKQKTHPHNVDVYEDPEKPIKRKYF